jgi:hypothetical protein
VTLTLESATLRATVTPRVGGMITSVRHLPTGTELLARAPWPTLTDPLDHAEDEATWLTRFPGGWPVMFPNAGDACTVDGVAHGFHGEGSAAEWEASGDRHSITLTRRFRSVPVTMTRHLRLEGDRLDLAETVAAQGPATVAWGQHVTLDPGPPGARLETSAARLAACATYDPPANPLSPGAEAAWPILPGKRGPVDLSRPPEGAALLACLMDLGPAPWAALTRADGLTLRLDWTADPWPFAWVWVETGGSTGPPWNGQARMLGIEPCSTWPATGLGPARAAGGPVITLRAGQTRDARLTLTATA